MIVPVIVKTRKKRNKIYWEKIKSGKDRALIIETTKFPVSGQANESVIDMIAEFFNVPTNKVFIRLGRTSKYKIVEIGE